LKREAELKSQTILMPIDVPADCRALFETRFDVVSIPEGTGWDMNLHQLGENAEAVVTRGSIGFNHSHFLTCPNLRIICCVGAGYEKVDLETARARKVVVANGAGTNAACVAEHAVMLTLALFRGLFAANAAVRAGSWNFQLPMPQSVSGKRMGILGLGNIGHHLSTMAVACGMTVGYCNRNPVPDLPFGFFSTPIALAEWCDVLVVLLPGSPDTRHIISADILAAIGSKGYLINVGRGSNVDEAALSGAILSGKIAGAALDVFENEPSIDSSLLEIPNLIVTPHIAGRSPQSRVAMHQLAFDHLTNFFDGLPITNRIV
jgi:lactate dehydrogenase-like 2-hydroxyacid dehydrogenase